MEKVMYLVWRPDSESSADFGARLHSDVVPALLDVDVVEGLQLNAADEHVAAGSSLVPDGLRRASVEPQPQAVISVWFRSSVWLRREPVDEIILGARMRSASYLVSESEVLVNPNQVPLGERSEGFAQIAMFRRPEGQPRDHWLSRWRDHHTRVAIETQSTFEYRQNLVVDRMQVTGPVFDAIVEEGFPHAALVDRAVFYDSVGSPERQRRNQFRMSSSTRTFIDHEHGLDVIPTSQYVYRRPPGH